MQQQIAEAIGAKDAGIFDAHLWWSKTDVDRRSAAQTQARHCNVEYIFQEVANRYAESLSQIDDPYLRERALDIQDVTRRVIHNLRANRRAPSLRSDRRTLSSPTISRRPTPRP